MEAIQPFHLAIPVDDVQKARAFYRDVMQCPEGRHTDHWVDFNFFGHQLVIHYKEKTEKSAQSAEAVDGKHVPIPHFGVVLKWEYFHTLADRLQGEIDFVIEPHIRFEGKVGEQATMFFYDPCGNALEFKAFKDMTQLFAT